MAGRLTIAIRSSPQPPSRGTNSIQYAVTSADGTPVDDLTLDVIPWMPAMGHGTRNKPTVEAQGGGLYVIHDVNFYMAGLWELRTKIEGTTTGEIAPRFQIP